MRKAKIVTPFGNIIIELNKQLSPKTVEAIWNFLPMKYKVPIQTWGEEIFFYLPDIDILTNIGYENARVELNVNDVAFWPRDPAICLFFGRTPLSKNDFPVATEPVNIIGKIVNLSLDFHQLSDGDLILMDKFEDD